MSNVAGAERALPLKTVIGMLNRPARPKSRRKMKEYVPVLI